MTWIVAVVAMVFVVVLKAFSVRARACDLCEREASVRSVMKVNGENVALCSGCAHDAKPYAKPTLLRVA